MARIAVAVRTNDLEQVTGRTTVDIAGQR